MAITYTPTTNFGAKDSLPTNDAAKVIKGAEFSTEFTAIQAAFSLAAPTASPTFSGTVTIPTLTLGSTAVTATASELNVLDGITATTAELNILDGVTATNTELNVLDGITATTAELNILDGVTATNTELNVLDGITATTSELNILDGVTATNTELNVLDGITATTAELNILNGVTATNTELNVLDGITATTAELNILDGVTATNTELNVLDGITATTTELNVLDGITATTTELNYTDGVTSNIQTQLDAKAPLASPTFTGDATFDSGTLFIDSSLNRVGIGTISPSEALEVQGNIRLSSFTNAHYCEIERSGGDLRLKADAGDTDSLTTIQFSVDGSIRAQISPSSFYLSGSQFPGSTQGGAGFIAGIGDLYYLRMASEVNTAQDFAVFINSNGTVGSISVLGSTTSYNTSSDERLKENIKNAESAGEKIDCIKVRQFDWKADGAHQDYGMVAQELLEVVPEAVTVPENPDEMLGVDYSKLVPMMLKEIQSLRARVAALEA